MVREYVVSLSPSIAAIFFVKMRSGNVKPLAAYLRAGLVAS